MNRLESLREQRKALAALVRELLPYDGKHWNRLGEATRLRIEDAAMKASNAGACVAFLGYPGSISAPVVTSAKAQDLLTKIEEDIHLIDSLESNPLLDDARQALETLARIEKSLREDDGIVGGLRLCAQAGLLRGYPNWGY